MKVNDMVSYETNLNAATVEQLSEVAGRCLSGILDALISGFCAMVAAFVLGGLYIALDSKPFHYAAVLLSLIGLASTFYSLWVLFASIHKVKSFMGSSLWRLPNGVTARFITVDFLGQQAIFETITPNKGGEYRHTLNERRGAPKTAQPNTQSRILK
jgi:hypothetical protein